MVRLLELEDKAALVVAIESSHSKHMGLFSIGPSVKGARYARVRWNAYLSPADREQYQTALTLVLDNATSWTTGCLTYSVAFPDDDVYLCSVVEQLDRSTHGQREDIVNAYKPAGRGACCDTD
ncbi:MAG: hypothetical protein AAGG07_14195 [Planctomycetota bacterium]